MSQARAGSFPVQGQPQYASADMYNQQFNRNSDTELINLAHEAHPVRYKARPFDWFICSVFGYMCFCWTGICAMYYSIRANHAVDFDKDNELISSHTKRAKCLTLLSIGLGVGICVVMIIVMVANHAVDYDRDDDLISNHTRKAKCLTLLSIGLGVLIWVIVIIVIAVIAAKAASAANDLQSMMSDSNSYMSNNYN